MQRQCGCVETLVTEVWKILHPPLMEMKPSDPSGFGPLLISVTQSCSDTSRDLGLCMENESTRKAYMGCSPGRSVSDGSVAHCKYSHLRTVVWCPNTLFLSVLKQITITPMITTVRTNFCCCPLHFWEESQVLNLRIEALPVDVSRCLSPSA